MNEPMPSETKAKPRFRLLGTTLVALAVLFVTVHGT